MHCVAAILFLLIPCRCASFSNKLSYPPKRDVYEFWLEVDYRVTMAFHDDEGAHALYYDLKNESFSQRTPCDKYEDFEEDLSKVIIGDGLHRFVLAFNGSVPGPTLTVYQNSTIIVHVTNKAEEPISVHWHGLEMRNAFYMDGVGMVTQCPIMPGQDFTYKFHINDTAGTYWYHGHTGVNVGDGLYGALIILADDDKKFESDDYIAVVSDWFSQESNHFEKYVFFENEEYIPSYEDKKTCYKMTRDFAGTKVGTWPWNSGVINGKGWHNVDELKNSVKLGKDVPIEKLLVSSKIKPKIRLISASFVYPLIISVSNHRLTVVSVDSYPIEPTIVDYIVMVQGERYDVLLEPIDGSPNGTYIMKAETVERFDNDLNDLSTTFKDHFAAALIIYDQKKPQPISIVDRSCTKTKPCLVMNCLFESYPSQFNRSCVHLTDLRSKSDPPKTILDEKPDHYEEHFLNMFADEPGYTINGIYHAMPMAPLFMQPNAYKKCQDDCGYKQKCKCTHIISLTKGNVVEFILYNRPKDIETMLDEGLGHPFHTHGHHFYVLETGWPKYNENATLEHYNQATSCDHFYCNYAKWNSNSTTVKLRSKKRNPKPVAKDTVFVPVGAYVIIRFVADNPGWWLAHCHQGPHHAMGMAFIMKEGKTEEMAIVPDDFPVCGYRMKDVKRS